MATSLLGKDATSKRGAPCPQTGSLSSQTLKIWIIRALVSKRFLIWRFIVTQFTLKGHGKEDLSRSNFKDLLAENETDCHDVKIETRSINGDKAFTS